MGMKMEVEMETEGMVGASETHQQHICYHAHGPHVRWAAVAALEHLRSHRVDGANNFLHLLAAAELLAETEIKELHVCVWEILLKHDVLEFDVSESAARQTAVRHHCTKCVPKDLIRTAVTCESRCVRGSRPTLTRLVLQSFCSAALATRRVHTSHHRSKAP